MELVDTKWDPRNKLQFQHVLLNIEDPFILQSLSDWKTGFGKCLSG